jgi:hypothetical protein
MAGESTIVSAVGVASVATGANKVLGARLSAAMSQAVLACTKAGISTDERNSPLIRACMFAARDAVKAAALSGDATPDGERIASAVAGVIAAKRPTSD